MFYERSHACVGGKIKKYRTAKKKQKGNALHLLPAFIFVFRNFYIKNKRLWCYQIENAMLLPIANMGYIFHTAPSQSQWAQHYVTWFLLELKKFYEHISL